jgi:hypothetical protein
MNGACATQVERSALLVLTERLPAAMNVPRAHQHIHRIAFSLEVVKR